MKAKRIDLFNVVVVGTVTVGMLVVVSCTTTDKQKALDAFDALAGQVCVEHDSWGVCLAKCKAACANPSATPAPSSSASGAAP